MNTDALLLPQSLFWTLEGGFGFTLLLLLWTAQAARRGPGSPVWRLVLAQGLLVALALLIAACQLGTFTLHSLDASALFNLALLVLAGALHLLVAGLWPRPQPPTPTVRLPTPLRSQHRRREARRWNH